MVTVTKYVWDPVFDCVTHELDENNAVKAVYNNEPQQYGGVLSQRRGTTSHYHHHDALGSTRFLTDSSGNVTDTYLHDAWGNSIASTGTTVNPFKWVGKYGYYTDNITGQVYVRARMYQPTVARWISVDPLPFIDGANLYEYCHNFLLLNVDPSGKYSCTVVKATEYGPVAELGVYKNSKGNWIYHPGVAFATELLFAPPCSCCRFHQWVLRTHFRVYFIVNGKEQPSPGGTFDRDIPREDCDKNGNCYGDAKETPNNKWSQGGCGYRMNDWPGPQLILNQLDAFRKQGIKVRVTISATFEQFVEDVCCDHERKWQRTIEAKLDRTILLDEAFDLADKGGGSFPR